MISASVLVFVLGGSAPVFGQRQPRIIPLHQAAAIGDVAQIKLHIEKKTDLNALNEQGDTALKLAVASQSVDCVKALLEGGANPNLKDSNGSTPLMDASMAGNVDMVNAMVAAKADLTIANSSGWTALYCAVFAGQYDAAEVLIKAGADVNTKDPSGQTVLALAEKRNQPEIADLLKKNGAIAPQVVDPYGGALPGGQAAAAPAASQRPADFVIDPNAIRKQIEENPTLQPPLKVIDANSESEQRAWIARRADNRTAMLRLVQKQFEEEMAFVKRTANEEKAEKTVKAVDDLVAARKNRYKLISEQLRDQRRQTLQETRDMGTTGRGGMTGRSGRGRGSTGGGAAQDPYAGGSTQTRAPRRGAEEGNEPVIDADTQSQIQSWLNAKGEDKADLLKTVQELDVIEYAILHKSAEEEKAAKTQVAIMGLLMQREARAAKIQLKWKEDDERAQRMQERGGTNGMQDNMQQGTQTGSRRGGRR